MKTKACFIIFLILLSFDLGAEPVRVLIAGEALISLDRLEGTTVALSYTDTALIRLAGDQRFFRGIQLDLSAPQNFLAYRGSLALALYADLDRVPQIGIDDIDARQLYFNTLPDKILNTWQIPMRTFHGLRSSPYVAIPTDIIHPSSFPILFRLLPVVKGISEELEKMSFYLQVKPILSDEGALRINFSYPAQLQGRPIAVLIDDAVIEKYNEEFLIREGEHHLLILSEDYRNVSRRFLIERAKTLELQIELQDPTPLLIFEHPEGARIFVDSKLIAYTYTPYPVEPGIHELRFEMSNYSIVRPISVQKGKTYRIAVSVDLNITENE